MSNYYARVDSLAHHDRDSIRHARISLHTPTHRPTFLPMITPTCSVGTYRNSVKWSRRCCVYTCACRLVCESLSLVAKTRPHPHTRTPTYLVGLLQLPLGQGRRRAGLRPSSSGDGARARAATATPPVVAVDPPAATAAVRHV